MTNHLEGKDPRAALRLIDRLGLYKFIFIDPTVQTAEFPSTENWPLVYEFLYELKSNETPGSIYQSLVRSEDAQFTAWVLAALTPWSTIPLPKPTPAGKQLLPLPTLVAQKGIKLNNKICEIVTGAFRNLQEITSLRDSILKKEPLIQERDTLGMTIRRWDFQGKNWKLQVLLAVLVESMTTNEAGKFSKLWIPSIKNAILIHHRQSHPTQQLAKVHRASRNPRSHGRSLPETPRQRK